MDETTTSPVFLAYLIVGAMTTAILLPILRPVFRKWAGTARASRGRAVISAALLLALVYFGGSTEKQQRTMPFTPESFFGGQPSPRTGENPSLPQWYVDREYPATDTDGDGIPDLWERWTHTNPAVADADADPDHDGVDNAEEFLHRCDPVKADTDGDGLDDHTEIDGLLAAVPDLDPLSPATYTAVEPDSDGDGIPDIWGDPTQYVPFEDLDGDGFCDALEDEYWNLEHGAEVVFHVWSSRSCVLETGIGLPLFLPPCTNLAIRACVPTDCDTEAVLRGTPNGSAATGTWKARLSAEWPPSAHVAIDRNRIPVADGAVLDIEPEAAVFTGALGGAEPQRQSGGLRSGPDSPTARNSTGIWFWRKEIELSVTPFCLNHGPGPVVTATLTRIAPPLHWEILNTPVSEDGGTTFSPQSASGDGEVCAVRCSKLDGHANVVLSATLDFTPSHCVPSVTNIIGAGWTSSHNPTNASDHAPGVSYTYEHFTEDCPVTTNVNWRIGVKHLTPVRIRNLLLLLIGDERHDNTDHCVGLVWDSSHTLSLWDYLDPTSEPYASNLVWRANGRQVSGGMLDYGTEPDRLYPSIFHVTLEDKNTGNIYDRLWVTVNSRTTQTVFGHWVSAESRSLSWTSSLPAPFEHLATLTNTLGTIEHTGDPEPSGSSWNSPEPMNVHCYLHHDAVYEMRSAPVAGGHGHQATYDSDGNLIRTTIAAGTADKFSPSSLGAAGNHRDEDVHPYLDALQLDGNPVRPTNGTGLFTQTVPSRLDAPCLYQGSRSDDYLSCRPSLPTGTTP